MYERVVAFDLRDNLMETDRLTMCEVNVVVSNLKRRIRYMISSVNCGLDNETTKFSFKGRHSQKGFDLC